MDTTQFRVLKEDISSAIPLTGFDPICASPAGQKDTAIYHTISGVKFLKYQSLLPGGPFKATVISRADIDTLISPTNVTYLQCSVDGSNNISVTAITTPAQAGYVDYSNCLFIGIDAMDNPDKYSFCAAVDQDGNNTVVFQTLLNGTVINYYDLSNAHP